VQNDETMIDLQDSSLPQKQRESSSNEGSITSLVDIKASHVAMRDLFTQIREAAGVTGEDEKEGEDGNKW